MNKQLTRTFDRTNVRVAIINSIKRMAAIDICKALGYKNPRAAWHDLKKRNGNELKQFSVVSNLQTTDGKSYNTDTLNLKGVIRLCMLASTPKATRFRDWATDVLAGEITGEKQPPFPWKTAAPISLSSFETQLGKAEKLMSRVEKYFGSLTKDEHKLYAEYVFKCVKLPVVHDYGPPVPPAPGSMNPSLFRRMTDMLSELDKEEKEKKNV